MDKFIFRLPIGLQFLLSIVGESILTRECITVNQSLFDFRFTLTFPASRIDRPGLSGRGRETTRYNSMALHRSQTGATRKSIGPAIGQDGYWATSSALPLCGFYPFRKSVVQAEVSSLPMSSTSLLMPKETQVRTRTRMAIKVSCKMVPKPTWKS